jgi:hypothetical protein
MGNNRHNSGKAQALGMRLIRLAASRVSWPSVDFYNASPWAAADAKKVRANEGSCSVCTCTYVHEKPRTRSLSQVSHSLRHWDNDSDH